MPRVDGQCSGLHAGENCRFAAGMVFGPMLTYYRGRPILLKNSIAHRPRCRSQKSTSQIREGDANDERPRVQ